MAYPTAMISRTEAQAILEHIRLLKKLQPRVRVLERAMNTWYAKENRLRKSRDEKNAQIRDLRRRLEAVERANREYRKALALETEEQQP